MVNATLARLPLSRAILVPEHAESLARRLNAHRVYALTAHQARTATIGQPPTCPRAGACRQHLHHPATVA